MPGLPGGQDARRPGLDQATARCTSPSPAITGDGRAPQATARCASRHLSLDTVRRSLTYSAMIASFKRRGLRELFETGKSAGINPNLHRRAIVRLDALDAARSLGALRQPGFDFHALEGKPQRYSIHVNGPWCITFEWEDGNALRVELEQYH
jgi:proteic killer suppression protein